MKINENIIYYYCKKILLKSGIYVFAGEPPGGSDELHRVELKMPKSNLQGSYGSRKFDLIAYHQSVFLLIELKDSEKKHNEDILKLNDTIDNELWIRSFWNNMNERNLFGNGKIPNYSEDYLVENKLNKFQKCLGGPISDYKPPEDYIYFEIKEEFLNCKKGKISNKSLFFSIERSVKEYLKNILS